MTRNPPKALPEFPEVRSADAAAIASWELSLNASTRSASTKSGYLLAIRTLARWLAHGSHPSLLTVKRADLERYIVWMREEARTRHGHPWASGYINNQYRAMQQFYRWVVEEEDIADPMKHLKSPKVEDKVVPVFTPDQLRAILGTVENHKDWESRRDLAIIRLFLKSGVRLTELAMAELHDINLATCSMKVMGKGSKERVVKFDAKTAQAIDRYLRVRVYSNAAKGTDRVWLGTNHRLPMTPNGIRQMINRRSEQAGLRVHPHMFRHHWAHTWLDRGGSESDLMELAGWSSPQMLRRYGRSARASRAQRSYDRIMGDD